jgi:hypothetical protein
LRVEDQLGFKMVKTIEAIESVEKCAFGLQGKATTGSQILWGVGERLDLAYAVPKGNL